MVKKVGQAVQVTLDITNFISGSGRHVTGDNFFPSLGLTKTLLG